MTSRPRPAAWGIGIVAVIGVVAVTSLGARDLGPLRGIAAELGLHASTPAPTPSRVELDRTVPSDLAEALGVAIRSARGPKLEEVSGQSSDYRVTVVPGAAANGSRERLLYTSYLLPVGHLYWIREAATTADLSGSAVYTTQRDQSFTDAVLSAYVGAQVHSTAVTLPDALLEHEDRVGIVDLSELDDRYKVLQLNGAYFMDDPVHGGIAFSVVVEATTGSRSALDRVAAVLSAAMPPTFSRNDLLVVNMTGTTAITRALGLKIEQSGHPDYASQRIAPFLKQADIVHISNEVSFVDGCNPILHDTSFCAVPAQVANFDAIGVNVVELTGNHLNDYGPQWATSTMQLYQQRGWGYFGGGLNASDAARILYRDVKGTRLAFLGYNYYDTVHHTQEIATDPSHPGSNAWSPDRVKSDIAAARAGGAQDVIVDIQYQECWAYVEGNTNCYAPIPDPDQKADFRQVIDDGADIVIGTQAHQAQTYEIYKGKPIFYGLGNLFFDQWEWTGTRQGEILTHYFWKGRYLTTRLTTTDYDTSLQVYVSTGTERLKLLNSLAAARTTFG